MLSTDYIWPQSFESHLTCQIWTDKIMRFQHSFLLLILQLALKETWVFKLEKILSFLKESELFSSDILPKMADSFKKTMPTPFKERKKKSHPKKPLGQKFRFKQQYDTDSTSYELMVWAVSCKRKRSKSLTKSYVKNK